MVLQSDLSSTSYTFPPPPLSRWRSLSRSRARMHLASGAPTWHPRIQHPARVRLITVSASGLRTSGKLPLANYCSNYTQAKYCNFDTPTIPPVHRMKNVFRRTRVRYGGTIFVSAKIVKSILKWYMIVQAKSVFIRGPLISHIELGLLYLHWFENPVDWKIKL